jgi:tetratricopeptide (TPR) repeat protein
VFFVIDERSVKEQNYLMLAAKLGTSLILLSFYLSLPSPGWSQDQPDTKGSRASYEIGVKHYDLAEYDNALISFKNAYRAKSDPAFLFNIAQCLRKMGRLDESSTFYRNYLRRAPEAANRYEVERRLRDIEIQLATTTPVIRPNAFSPETPTLINLSPRPTPKTEESPLYKKWWIWTAAGAVVAGTTTTIIILTRRDPTSVPSTGLGYQRALP